MSVLIKPPLAAATVLLDTAAVLLLPTVNVLKDKSTPTRLLPSESRTVAAGLPALLLR